ncbi:hypothetical protein NON00_04485 [Roseomonas sp. GC11]|nr:hypothetical protein [Roseomonas sp. GC11]MCQ4159178.1 hypothetical protein [Roseomonas sp. GC11]
MKIIGNDGDFVTQFQPLQPLHWNCLLAEERSEQVAGDRRSAVTIT